jgi:hypothetical protein
MLECSYKGEAWIVEGYWRINYDVRWVEGGRDSCITN